MASSQPTPSPFGHLLRRMRRAVHLTQEELAERAGLSLRGVSDLERGINRTPRRETVRLLSDALGLGSHDRAALEAAARARTAPSGISIPCAHVAPGVAAGLPAFVGRQPEMDRIARHLAAVGSRASLLLVAGEPGIGKSRLLAEAERETAPSGWQVLSGGCTRRSGQQPYAPFGETLARTLTHLSLAEQRRALSGCAWLVRLLPELLETAVVPAPSWMLPPEQERRLMFAAVARYLANVAGPAGTLLLLDDLQWAGGDALDLLDSLVHVAAAAAPPAGMPEQAAAPRLRIVAAYRSTEVDAQHPLGALHADLARAGLAALRCALGPLPAADARALAEALVIERTADAAEREVLVDRLICQAGGVPFYLVNCAQAARRSTIEADLARGDRAGAGAQTETDGVGVGAVPWLVAETIRQRVAALPEPARDLLGAAAVLGRVVPSALLTAVAPSSVRSPDADILPALDAACRARLLEERDDGPEGNGTTAGAPQYQFAHDLIREVVLCDLGAARRARLHHAAGEALEKVPERERHRRAAELAWHFQCAGAPARALPYSLMAGDQAAAIYAHAEAEQHYRTALELAQELGERAREAEALKKLGLVLRARAHRAEALEVLEHAAHIYEELGDTEAELHSLAALGTLSTRARPEDAERTLARLLLRLAMLDQQRGNDSSPAPSAALFAIYETLTLLYVYRWRWAEADEALGRAEQIARTLSDEALLVRVLSLRTRREEQIAGVGPIALALELIALAERLGDTHVLMEGLDVVFNGSLYAGELVRAQQHVERWVALAERVGMLGEIAIARINSGELAFYRGEWGEARAAIERAWTLSTEMEQLGDPDSPDFHGDLLGPLDLAEGRDQEAVKRLSVTLAWARNRQWNWYIADTGRVLAERDLVAGRATEARTQLQELLSLPGVRTHAAGAALALPNLAWAEAEVGEVERAAATVEEGITAIEAAHYQLFLPEALRIRALIAAKQQRWEAADADLTRAIEMAQAMPYPYAEAKALYVYGQLHAARGEPEYAREKYQAALAICVRLGEGLYRPHIERALADLGAD
jgi:tetratricopeptide (TPR) repeat protein